MTGGVLAILFILALYGVVGFLDDFLKIFRKINEGLNPKQKLALQILGGIVFYFVHVRGAGGGELNVFGHMVHLGVLYFPFVLFWLVGFSNAVNLTDGIDGLASISVVISLLAYSVIAFNEQKFDILLVCVTMIGGLLGFFVYNRKPAKIFMGMWEAWLSAVCWQLFQLPSVRNGLSSLSAWSMSLKRPLLCCRFHILNTPKTLWRRSSYLPYDSFSSPFGAWRFDRKS